MPRHFYRLGFNAKQAIEFSQPDINVPMMLTSRNGIAMGCLKLVGYISKFAR
jgi:hypothetical protein